MKAVGKRWDEKYLVHLGSGVVIACDLKRGVWCDVPDPDAILGRRLFKPMNLAENDELAPRFRKVLDNQHGKVTLAAMNLQSEMGYSEKQSRVEAALRQRLGVGGGYGSMGMDFWQRDMNDTHVIYQWSGKTYRRGYSMDVDGTVSFDQDAEEVTQGWVALNGSGETLQPNLPKPT